MMYPNVSSAHVFRYLNDGQFMGNAGALKTMIDSVLEDIEQGATFLEPIKFRAGAEIAARWLSRYMFHNPEDIAIDSRGDLFFSLEGATADSLGLERNKVKSKVTGTSDSSCSIALRSHRSPDACRHNSSVHSSAGTRPEQDVRACGGSPSSVRIV